MTFLELCQKVREECGIQGQGPASVANQTGILKRIVGWTRDADLFIQNEHSDWNFLWSEFTADTVLNSDKIARPSDLGQWDREAFAIDRGTALGASLNLITFQEQRINSNIRITARPSSVAILPNYDLAFSVPANGVYQIYGNYWKTPVQLTNDADVPAYPERYQRAIISKAKMWFFEDIESGTQRAEAEADFDTWYGELESYALPEQQEANQSSPVQMAVRPE